MRARILLVDDSPEYLLLLKTALERSDYEIETATSLRESLQKMQDGAFQLVITDLQMETETSGYDVIRAALQQAYEPATAILTGHPPLGSEWLRCGAQLLLVKPVKIRDLLRQIEALLAQRETHKHSAASWHCLLATMAII